MHMLRVGVLGASGYVGTELLRLLAGHPDMEVVYAAGDSQAGSLASAVAPSLAAAYPDLVIEELEVARALACDVVFLALPHEASMAIVPDLVDRVRLVVDLSAAYRLADADAYPAWYGFAHTSPALLPRAAYGLPELGRDRLRGARLVATPGCYVTAASLALRPLVEAGAIDPRGVIVDAASGVSGAGRTLKAPYLYGSVNEDFTAYGLLDHRHTPEIEQVTGAQVLFTPHLAPMNRGILATCYARPAAGAAPTTAQLLATLSSVTVLRVPPLRDYAEDVPDLLRHSVDRFVDGERLPFRRFGVPAQNRLRNYPWPGNVQELRALVRRLLERGGAEEISLEEIERELVEAVPPSETLVKQDLLSLGLREAREHFERAYLQQQLLLCHGKVGQLAKRVGMERTHLYRKLRALGVDFRSVGDDET